MPPRTCLILLALFTALAIQAAAAESPKFELVDGDRVVLVGNSFIDRCQYDGYLETLLVSRFPGRRISLRNLGWDGDTLYERQRPLNFGPLTAHLAAERPTVVMVCYGMMESLDGPAGLPKFAEKYRQHLDELAATGARMVVISPHKFEPLPRLSNVELHNQYLAAYVHEIEKIAAQRKYVFVNLFDTLELSGKSTPRQTVNGTHLSEAGYRRAARAIAEALGVPRPHWHVELSAHGKLATAQGTRCDDIKSSPGTLRLRATDVSLPNAPAGANGGGPVMPDDLLARVLKVSGLDAGTYTLWVEGKSVGTATAEQWAQGVAIADGPESVQVESLRRAINRKNQLFYYRYRPHNGEYVYGRRSKSFNGNSGNDQFPLEMKQMDKLIAATEAEIFQLAQPRSHRYELFKDGKGLLQ